ncbi:hypothetical protein [Dactylosporangium sp. NPDC005555]|uniref:hypothetical protein n=1 Tax=Dactylosporangium sp. NPDC005555 TaxID=3154889 RepID=UPI0033BDA9A0
MTSGAAELAARVRDEELRNARHAVALTARFRDAGDPDAAVHTDIAGFFTGTAERRLVILGAAGAGKSALAGELIPAASRAWNRSPGSLSSPRCGTVRPPSGTR